MEHVFVSSNGEAWDHDNAEYFDKSFDVLRGWFFDMYLKACSSEVDVADLTSMIPTAYWQEAAPSEALRLHAIFGKAKQDRVQLEKLMFRLSQALGRLVLDLPLYTDRTTSARLQDFLNSFFLERGKLSLAQTKEDIFEVIERMVVLAEKLSSTRSVGTWWTTVVGSGGSIYKLLLWVRAIIATYALTRITSHLWYMLSEGIQMIADEPTKMLSLWAWYDRLASMFPEQAQPLLDFGLRVLTLNTLVRDKWLGGVKKSDFFREYLQYPLEKRETAALDLMWKFASSAFRQYATLPMQMTAGACMLLATVFLYSKKQIALMLTEVAGDTAFRKLCDLVDAIAGGESMRYRVQARQRAIRQIPSDMFNISSKIR